ncbi:M50 family metallopeptidase [Thermophilibacter sp.]
MSGALGVIWIVVCGVVALSALVFVHEGGHYLAARAFRVRATEFYLGLPCRWRLARKSRKVGTEFGVTPLLLGGYTRICGMEGAPDELLGPALKLVTDRGRVRADELARELGVDEARAYALLATLVDWAAARPFYDPELGEHEGQRDWPAAFEAPARDANLLTEYDRGHDFSLEGSTAAGEPHPCDLDAEGLLAHERARTYQGVGFVRRCAMLLAGPLVNVALAFVLVTGAFMIQGVTYVANVPTLGGVSAGSAAEAAGLRAGDTITSVDGTEVSTWEELSSALAPLREEGRDFEVTFVRDGRELTATVDLPDGQAVPEVGVLATTGTYHLTLPEAAAATLDYTGQVASYVAQLIQPAHTMEVLDQSSSVVGIANMVAQAASTGVSDLVTVVAAISMSLGFMNLLPIPPFDGGKILIEVIQLVIRRPLSERVQVGLSYAGLAFIMFVFVVVLRNDILRYVV